jgi:hypothetical protein
LRRPDAGIYFPPISLYSGFSLGECYGRANGWAVILQFSTDSVSNGEFVPNQRLVFGIVSFLIRFRANGSPLVRV